MSQPSARQLVIEIFLVIQWIGGRGIYKSPKKLSVHVNTSNFPALYITVQLSNRTIQWFSDSFWILMTIISLTYLPLICRSLHKDMKQRLIGKPQMAISGQFTKGSLVNSWMVDKGNYPTTDYYILSYTIYILSIYYIYTIYILSIYYLSIYYLYTIYILSIYYLYTIYILSILYLYTIAFRLLSELL